MKAKLMSLALGIPLLVSPALSAQEVQMVQSPQRVQMGAQSSTFTTVAARRVHRRRSTKKSAMIVGGTALGGAAIGGLAGGKKGAALGALAGAGAGYVYDRKSQQKPLIPK